MGWRTMSVSYTHLVLPFLFMIVSGLLSTVDSNLCAASSLMTDMNGGKELKKTKCAMIALLCVGILIANIPGMTVTPVSYTHLNTDIYKKGKKRGKILRWKS